MKRRFALALGALSLGWLAGGTQADEPAASAPPGQSRTTTDAADTTAQPSTMAPIDAGTIPDGGTPIDGAGPCCGPLGDGCCNHFGDGGSHFTGGVGLYLLHPNLTANPAFARNSTTAATPANGETTTVIAGTQDFGYDVQASPRVWLGYVCDSGLGGRVSYWHFEDSANTFEFTNPGPAVVTSASVLTAIPGITSNGAFGTDHLAFTSDLRMDVLDLEATQDVKVCLWQLLISGGVRYDYINQSYGGFRTGPTAGGATEVDTVLASHSFTGVGPTLALEARRPLSDCGLSLFVKGRGSVVFGYDRESGYQHDTAGIGSTIFNQSIDQDTSRIDEVSLIAEIEAGVEWSCDMGPTRVFLQPALVGMWFNDAGSATTQAGNVGLLGFSLVAGVMY
jgi:hypothetical protein